VDRRGLQISASGEKESRDKNQEKRLVGEKKSRPLWSS
jgi:hypothetical protein